MKLDQIIKNYFLKKWWFSVLLFGVSSLFVAKSFASTNSFIITLSDFLFLLTGIILLIVGIWQVFKGKWYLGFLQLAILFMGVFVLAFISSFMMMFGPDTDTFADNLSIPENVELNYPIDLRELERESTRITDSLIAKDFKGIKFQLYNSFQPGLFQYDLWLNTAKNGTIYLKVYEITQNIQLSESRLKEASAIKVRNTEGLISKFGTDDYFTIYEGDWGKPYGARFEVWFIPEKSPKIERKLYETNYVIEGWMR